MNCQLISKTLKTSKIVFGCMRLSKLSYSKAEELVLEAVKNGINIFDHADIYGNGKCEELFGQIIENNQGLREKIIIQTKCGIKNNCYDLSKEHIITSVNNSLKKLKTDYIDILLLHRPDALMDLGDILEAFVELFFKKKVRYFGVSNMNSWQIEYIRKNINIPIVINQVQFSLVHAYLLDQGIFVNMKDNEAIDRSSGLLEYCAINDITVQAWSVLQASWEEGTFLDNPTYKTLNEKLEEIANKYSVTKNAIAIAWILRIPFKIQPVIGTTSIKHLNELVKATEIKLTREEWYALYLSVGKILP